MNTRDTIPQRIDAVGVQWDCLEVDTWARCAII